jgi:hypothetical protein
MAIGLPKLDFDGDVVTRHDHFDTLWEADGSGHVGRAEVELRAIVREERGMTTAFFLAQHIDFGLELLVRLDGTDLGDDLATLDVVLLDTTEENTDVVASFCGVEELAEHFDVGDGGLLRVAETNDFDFFTLLENTTLNTAGGHGATTFDVEHVFNREEEWEILRTLWHRDVGVHSLDQGEDLLLTFWIAVESLLGAARTMGISSPGKS